MMPANYLRPEFLNEVSESLEFRSKMTRYDFTITQNSIKSGALLKIVCNLKEEFYFEAEIFANKWNLKKNPGHKILQRHSIADLNPDNLQNEIRVWVLDVHKDLTTPIIYREFEQVYAELEGLQSRLEDIPDEPFSKAEGEALAQKLDELEEAFKSYIENNIPEEQEQEKRINELENDISFLKVTLFTLDKKKWYTGLATRYNRWVESDVGQAFIKTGTTIIKGLLASGG